MPKINENQTIRPTEIRLIQSVAKSAGIRLSSRMAVKASVAMDNFEGRALTVPEIEAFLHLWSDPTGETAVKNVMKVAA